MSTDQLEITHSVVAFFFAVSVAFYAVVVTVLGTTVGKLSDALAIRGRESQGNDATTGCQASAAEASSPGSARTAAGEAPRAVSQ